MRSLFVPATSFGVLAISAPLLRNYMSGGSYYGTEKMTGKTVVITGANTGIGKETARNLAGRGARVIMACRDEGKCEAARKEMIEDTGNKDLVCSKLNLASFASVRAFAKEVLREPRIDVLINNAGIMMCPKDLTEDGYEMQLGANHFVGSSLCRSMNFDDLNSDQTYGRHDAYAQSKLANLLHLLELSRRLEGTGVTVNSLHPGLVDTELGRHIPVIGNSSAMHFIIYPIKYILLKDPAQGAQTTIRLAVDPSLGKVSGKYFSDCAETERLHLALIEADAKRLWDISEKVTQIKEA